jgi:hypothetical protein
MIPSVTSSSKSAPPLGAPQLNASTASRFDRWMARRRPAPLDILTPAMGGLMVFDDCWYRRPELGQSFRPKLAVDAFVGAMKHETKVADVAG